MRKIVPYRVQEDCTDHSVWGGIEYGIHVLDQVQSREKVAGVSRYNVESGLTYV